MAEHPSIVSGIFKQPFAEQVAFFRGKLTNLAPTEKWDDLWHNQHDNAFMVAGATRADLLSDLAEAVQKAIEDGTGLEEFRRSFSTCVQKYGWKDYTGGFGWRTRIILNTNANTSYAAGRLAQLQKFPLWVYRHNDSVLHPRPHHVALDGLTLPSSHPFWQTHYPPNGWGCHCYVVGAEDMDMARMLGGGKTELPDGWNKPDPLGNLPGIDRGWDYQPGKTLICDNKGLHEKLNTMPEELSVALMQDWIQSDSFARWYENPTGRWPLVRIPEADAKKAGAGTQVATLSRETAIKQKKKHPEIRAAEYVQAQSVINYHTAMSEEGSSLIYVRESVTEQAGGHVLVVKVTKSGQSIFVTSFRRLSRKQAAREKEIARLLEKGSS